MFHKCLLAQKFPSVDGYFWRSIDGYFWPSVDDSFWPSIDVYIWPSVEGSLESCVVGCFEVSVDGGYCGTITNIFIDLGLNVAVLWSLLSQRQSY